MENQISSPGSFNIRVYGLLINEQRQVLVSDEYIRGSYYTKFPGGGLELGEGTRDCLKREFKEEMDLEVEIGEHLYTTDFYQVSAFNTAHQIISIYYLVKAMEDVRDPGADVDGPSGVGDVERSEGCRGNWRGPPWPRPCGGRERVCL